MHQQHGTLEPHVHVMTLMRPSCTLLIPPQAVCCRQTTRTAFVICPKSNRWSVLCRRGQKIAVEYMQKLLVEWQTCQVAAGQSDAQREKADVSVEVCASASTSDAAMASASFREDTQAAAATILTGSGMQSPTLAAPADAARDSEQQSDTAGRVEQPSAAVNQAAAQGRLADELYEIEEMCSAMWYTFGPGIARVAIGPYEKFVDLATKFNCSWVASQLLEHKYEVSPVQGICVLLHITNMS